jgi:hypothetical protein
MQQPSDLMLPTNQNLSPPVVLPAINNNTVTTPHEPFNPNALIDLTCFGPFCKSCKLPLGNDPQTIWRHYFCNTKQQHPVNWTVTGTIGQEMISLVNQARPTTRRQGADGVL